MGVGALGVELCHDEVLSRTFWRKSVRVATPILTYFENCSLFHAQSPDTGRGVHARSWRANRDVDVRRKFLGFCLRVHLLALFLDGPTPTHPSALHTRARPYLLSRH